MEGDSLERSVGEENNDDNTDTTNFLSKMFLFLQSVPDALRRTWDVSRLWVLVWMRSGWLSCGASWKSPTTYKYPPKCAARSSLSPCIHNYCLVWIRTYFIPPMLISYPSISFILSFSQKLLFYRSDRNLIQVILLSKYLISSLVVIYLIEYSLLVISLCIDD